MATRMMQRRGTAAEWAAANIVLAAGEIGYEIDTKVLKIGNGVTPWVNLAPVLDGTYVSKAVYDALVADFNALEGRVAALETAEPTPTDVTAPTTPGSFSAVIGDTKVTLSWAASADAVGVTGYRIYRNDVVLDTTPNLNYVDTAVVNETAYAYKVAAYDAAGNESAPTATLTRTPSATAPVSSMTDIRTKVHGPDSVWNKPIAQRTAAEKVVDTETSDRNGKTHAHNLAQQHKYNKVTATEGVYGYYDPGYGANLNLGNYSMPVYVVPRDQPLSDALWWSNWNTPWGHIGRNVQDDLEGQFVAVPLPTLSKCKPGANGMEFSRAAAGGDTVIYSTRQMYGHHSWAGGQFTVTDCVRVGTTSEFQLTITPGLAGGASVGNKTTRPNQMESDGSDRSLIILQEQADGAIKLWEFWGFRPDNNAPGGYSFANGGYVADTRNWNGVFPGTWGMRAVSMSAIGGAITLDDVKRGTINHALNIAIPVTGTVSGKNFDNPATRWDGSNLTFLPGTTSDGGDAARHRVRVGGYFRLPEAGWSDAQIATFVSERKSSSTDQAFAEMCIRAIRDYGLYITDSSGSVSFYGEGRQSVGTEYNPHTQADMDAVGNKWYGWYNLPFWDSLVKLAPHAVSTGPTVSEEPRLGTDGFNRPASTTSLGNFPDGTPYDVRSGTWGIAGSGRAYCSSATDDSIVVIDSRKLAWDVSAVCTIVPSGWWGLVGAYEHAGNNFRLEVEPSGTLVVVKRSSYVNTELLRTSSGYVKDGNVVRWNRTVVNNVWYITVWVNGVQVPGTPINDGGGMPFSKVGLRQGGSGALRWDDLTLA